MDHQTKRRKLSQPPSRPPSSFTVPLTRSHPYNVQPLGNFYLSSNPHNCIPPGLGSLFSLFPEPDLLSFLHHFTIPDLGLLSSLSKALYVYCHEEEHYKAAVLTRWQGTFHFHSTWRLTYLYMHVKGLKGEAAAEAEVLRQSSRPPPAIQGFYSDLLFQSFYCSALDLSHFSNADNIDRVALSDLTPDYFLQHYAIPNRPCIITGAMKDWPASHWTLDSLNSTHGLSPFKVGPHTMTLQAYTAYAAATQDESPLYLFDSGFVEKYPELGQGYEPPSYFARDLFALLQDMPAFPGYNDGCEDRDTPDAHMRGGRAGMGGSQGGMDEDEKKEGMSSDAAAFGSMRPAYRWILIGPARSGSTFHKDPNHTSAWNGLIEGRKRWILYPPTQPPPGIHISPDGRDVVTPISVTEWLLHYYSHHSRLLSPTPYTPLPLPHPCPPLSSLSSPLSYPPSHYSPHECVHNPGEILFIPHGWWHLAVNLTPSVAVTQNVVTEQNLLDVREFLKVEGNRALGEGLEGRVREVYPELIEKLEGVREEVERVRREVESEGMDRRKGKTRGSAGSMWASMIA